MYNDFWISNEILFELVFQKTVSVKEQFSMRAAQAMVILF
jgi:hypothetical protein